MARFAAVRDEGAFTELVTRHGAMVLGVCKRIVRQRQDAEDAFQAVFLALGAQARPLRRIRSLSGWLHNVAVRVSCDIVRANRRQSRKLESLAEHRQRSGGQGKADLQGVLDEELAALSPQYREAVVLCDLEGRTREEAARQLAVSAGTVASRLSRGRAALRERLLKRGVSLAAGGVAAALGRCLEASPSVPLGLTKQTVRAAQRFLAARGGGEVIAADKITTIAQGVLHTMFLSKISTTVGIAALAAALVLGSGPVLSWFGPQPEARAGTIFIDNFDDGSLTDNKPVSWRSDQGGSIRIQDQSLILTGNSVPLAVPNTPNRPNVSIQARVRLLEGTSIGLAGRRGVPVNGRESYFAYLVRDGATNYAGIAYGGSVQGIDEVEVPFDVRFEDVNLQLDIFGNQIKYWAWPANQPRPAAPLGEAIDNTLTNGSIFAFAGSDALSGATRASGAFRYIYVSDTPIVDVPEPSTAVLGSLGAASLFCFAFRARLARVRSGD